MCTKKLHSLAKRPQIGYIANVLVGKHIPKTPTQYTPTHEQWRVDGVAEDGSWADITDGDITKRVFAPVSGYDYAYSGDAKGKEPPYATFTRVPVSGDNARFYGSNLAERAHTVEAVSEDGTHVTLSGGEEAVLKPWGTYMWHECRGVEFTVPTH
jgi:hypothetical protein